MPLPPLPLQGFPPCRRLLPAVGKAATRFLLLLLLPAMLGCSVSPQPYTREEFLAQAREAKEELFRDQAPLPAKVGLHEAMARAVKYNIEHQVMRLEKALADGTLELGRYDLLPQVVASAGYTVRNNNHGSASKSLLSGNQSLEFSTSEEKDKFSAEIITVWNILDFGLAYTRAQQAADELLISEEQRRKTVQNIARDVRYAFWRAASAELLLPQMDGLLRRVESALVRSRQMEQARVESPVKTLAYQQQLLETVRQLWEMRRQLSLAKTELAALMNLEPGTRYEIDLEGVQAGYPAQLLSLAAVEEQALASRPELRIESYQQRISVLEARKALLERLPGLQFSLGASYDGNDYLYNSSWLQAGLNLSWNLFNIFSGPAGYRRAVLQQDLASRRQLAMAMMVLTQVNLAHQGYDLALKEYRIAEELAEVHRRRLWHMAAARKAQTGSELEEIRLQTGALFARMHQGVAFAELQSALGRLFQSGGVDPLPAVLETRELQAMAEAMAQHEKAMLAFLGAESETIHQASFFLPAERVGAASFPAPPKSPGGRAESVVEEEPTAKVREESRPEPDPLPVDERADRRASTGNSAVEADGSQLSVALAGRPDPNGLPEPVLVEPESLRIPLVSISQVNKQLLAGGPPQGLSYRFSPEPEAAFFSTILPREQVGE